MHCRLRVLVAGHHQLESDLLYDGLVVGYVTDVGATSPSTQVQELRLPSYQAHQYPSHHHNHHIY